MSSLYSKLEDVLTYQSHSEVCGCGEDHEDEWTINLDLTETEVRKLMGMMDDNIKLRNLIQRSLPFVAVIYGEGGRPTFENSGDLLEEMSSIFVSSRRKYDE